MNQTEQMKKEYLMRYQTMALRINILTDQAQELQEMAVRTTPFLSGMPGGGGPNIHKLEEGVERLMQAKERIAEALTQAMQIRQEIETVIESVPEEKLRYILQAKYLLGKSWGSMSDDLHMDERWLRRLHNRALAQLEIPAHVIAS